MNDVGNLILDTRCPPRGSMGCVGGWGRFSFWVVRGLLDAMVVFLMLDVVFGKVDLNDLWFD